MLAAWAITLVSGALLDYRDPKHDPDWVIGGVMLVAFFAGVAMTFSYLAHRGTAQDGRFTTSLLTVLIAMTLSTIIVGLVRH